MQLLNNKGYRIILKRLKKYKKLLKRKSNIAHSDSNIGPDTH